MAERAGSRAGRAPASGRRAGQPRVRVFRLRGGGDVGAVVRLRHCGHQRGDRVPRPLWHLSELGTEIATGSLLTGCILGAALAGSLSDGWGRKKALLLSAALFAFWRDLLGVPGFAAVGARGGRAGRVRVGAADGRLRGGRGEPVVTALHCRNLAGAHSRRAGGAEPDGDCDGHSAVVSGQLGAFVFWQRELAVDVRGGGDSGAVPAGRDAVCAGEPALADGKRTRRRSAGSARTGGRDGGSDDGDQRACGRASSWRAASSRNCSSRGCAARW